MRVLWLTNIAIPKIAENISSIKSPKGGWMVGLFEKIKDYHNIELSVVFPQSFEKKVLAGEIENIKYFGFYTSKKPWKYDKNVENQLYKIVNEINPDIVHIFGTEYPHALAMTKVFNYPNKIVISIQGLTSVISKHYYADLPKKVINGYTIRDLIRMDNIKASKRKFKLRGVYEQQAIKNVNYIIGRTDWDKACTEQLNPKAKYYSCNEILRKTFYSFKWDLNRCIRYSIFVSQGEYPIKGLHYVIQALPEIIKRFPKTHLYIAGHNITENNSFKSKVRITYYGKHIKKLIQKSNLNNYVTFTGNLDEKQMCNQFLKTHVFISPSTIENESNSLSEAKLLGVPVIASYVGGVTNRVRHYEDGFLYQHNAPYMLSYYICKLFSDDDLSIKFSDRGKKYIQKIVDPTMNVKRTVNIYNEIYQNQ